MSDLTPAPVVAKPSELDPAAREAAIRAALQTTDDFVKSVVPSTPNAALQTQLMSFARLALFGLSIAGVTRFQWVSADDLTLIVSIVGAVGTGAWVWWKNRSNAKREDQIAKASAAASAAVTLHTGVPTAVPVQPPPNLA